LEPSYAMPCTKEYPEEIRRIIPVQSCDTCRKGELQQDTVGSRLRKPDTCWYFFGMLLACRLPTEGLNLGLSSQVCHHSNKLPLSLFIAPGITVQRLGRVGDESAESYPSRPTPRRVRVTSRSTQLRGGRLSRESELTRSTQHYDDDFVPHRNSI